MPIPHKGNFAFVYLSTQSHLYSYNDSNFKLGKLGNFKTCPRSMIHMTTHFTQNFEDFQLLI